MQNARGYKMLSMGLVIGTLLGFIVANLRPLGSPRWITFPGKHIFNMTAVGADWATVTGRIDDRPGYPNNEVQITCRQSLRACQMVKIEEIDRPDENKESWPLIGDLDPAELFTISHWDKNSLVAVDEGFCEIRTLNIDFPASEAEIVVQPQNLADMHCKGTKPTLVRYPVEDAMDPSAPKKK